MKKLNYKGLLFRKELILKVRLMITQELFLAHTTNLIIMKKKKTLILIIKKDMRKFLRRLMNKKNF